MLSQSSSSRCNQTDFSRIRWRLTSFLGKRVGAFVLLSVANNGVSCRPRIRAYLIRNADQLAEGLGAMKTYSVNWADTRIESLVQPQHDPNLDERRLVLSPQFEAHIRNLDNWSLSSKVLATFPEWQGMARFV